MAQPRTLFDKIWDSHVIASQGEGRYQSYSKVSALKCVF